MKLFVLTENTAGSDFLAEHGLSYYIEYDGKRILFDTGHSEVYLRNAMKLGINLQTDTDIIILSHGHWDHGDGLQYINNKSLLTHPSAFIKRYHKNDNDNIGLKLSKKELEANFDLITTDKSYQITDSIFYLGEIPRLNDFEAQSTNFVDEEGNEDFVMDDSALSIIKEDGLIIVTGCSHSGICNIVEYAKKVCGIEKVEAVIGGFHLKRNDWQTENTIQYFKKNNIRKAYPSHCTELPALAALHNSLYTTQVKTGMVLRF